MGRNMVLFKGENSTCGVPILGNRLTPLPNHLSNPAAPGNISQMYIQRMQHRNLPLRPFRTRQYNAHSLYSCSLPMTIPERYHPWHTLRTSYRIKYAKNFVPLWTTIFVDILNPSRTNRFGSIRNSTSNQTRDPFQFICNFFYHTGEPSPYTIRLPIALFFVFLQHQSYLCSHRPPATY